MRACGARPETFRVNSASALAGYYIVITSPWTNQLHSQPIGLGPRVIRFAAGKPVSTRPENALAFTATGIHSRPLTSMAGLILECAKAQACGPRRDRH